MHDPSPPRRHRARPAVLQLTGSTTLLARMQRVAEAYMEPAAGPAGARVVIDGGVGTARGYKALLDGTTDLAMASGAAPAHLEAAAAARGLPFYPTTIGRDAILALLHPANPVCVLTQAELRAVFTGRIANWRALGGPDAAIEVLVGPPSGGVTGSWRARILGDDDTFTPAARVLATGERLACLAARPAAIGYAPAMAARTGLAAGRLAAPRVCAGPLARAAADPVYAPLTLVTLGAPQAEAARFIAYAAGRADLAGGSAGE